MSQSVQSASRLGESVIEIGYASHGGGSIPIWVGVEAGIFAKNGVTAEACLLEGTPPVVDRMQNGTMHFGNIASPPVLEANLKGRTDIVYLTGGLINIVHQLLVRADSGINVPTDLRGKVLGIRTSKTGNLVDIDAHLVSSIVPRIGLRLDEVERRPIGHAHAKAVEALEAHEVDGITLVEPYAALAMSRGHRKLVDSFELRIPFQLGGLVANRSDIEANPELTMAMVRSFVESIHFIAANRDSTVAIIRDYSKIDDPAVAEATYDAFVRYFHKVPYPSVEGLQAVLDLLVDLGVEGAADAKPEQFIDTSFLKKLEDDGFIDRLYADAS
jgi:ABC-type nitrate/sulfonate/bicarbonate transport system substrate-binding protein